MKVFRSAICFLFLAAASSGATFVVNSTADLVDAAPGDGTCYTGRNTPAGQPECTLRAAVEEANNLAGPDEITIPAGTYFLSTTSTCYFRYHFETSVVNQLSRSLCVLNDTKITGAGASSTIIDGMSVERVFWISGGATVTMSGVTVQRGLQPFGVSSGGGAGINVQGILTLTDSAVDGNSAPVGGGGGIYVNGSLTVVRSSVSNNSALQNTGQGGGISFYDGTLTIIDSTLSGNQAKSGGGIEIDGGTANISGSSILNNTADTGGGIRQLGGTMSIANSTISGNNSQQGLGGGVRREFQPGAAYFNNVTITQNSALFGAGAIYNNQSSLFLRNSILAGSIITQPAVNYGIDCLATIPITSNGYNIIQNAVDCTLAGDMTGNIIGQDPQLSGLSFNGGLTQTMALLPSSPAINAGSPLAPGSGGNSCAALDQRGVIRPQGGRCDIGAFERVGDLLVLKITPARGGNSASTVVVISGAGFASGAAARLRKSGQADILGSAATVEPGGASLSSSFDLAGAVPGSWDVTVTNPDATAATLPGGFTVQAPVAPQLWSYVVGRGVLRIGFSNRYTLVFGNRGNVDAYGVPLLLSTPGNMAESIYFKVTPPPAQNGQVTTDYTLVPIAVTPYSANTQLQAPFLIPVIPAGFTGTLEFNLSLDPAINYGSTAQFSAILGDPIFNPALDPKQVQRSVDGGIAYAQQNYGLTVPATAIPGIQAYATNQFLLIAAAGRDQLVATLGARVPIYSLGQMVIDVGSYAAAQSTLIAPKKSLLLYSSTSIVRDPCAGQVLLPGQSCGTTDHLPPPDNSKAPPFTPTDCRNTPKHHLSSDGTTCIPDDKKGCPLIPNPFYSDPNCLVFRITNSQDPNEKAGPKRGINITAQPSGNGLPYVVSFENKSTATAAAQQVVVTDQLDMTKVDLSTFSLGPISFGNITAIPPPGQTSYMKILDMRPAQNFFVRMDASLNGATGLITWRFSTLDPITGENTTDPLLGFLPPNTAPPAGEGHVLFTIKPKLPIATGAQICNFANIVFDFNAPILTNQFCNTIDDVPPVSSVLALSAQQSTPAFIVQWSGTDVGSAISTYDIYASDNGGPYVIWQQQTNLTQSTFSGVTGHTYSFFSIARDEAGNVEASKILAEATTTVQAASTCATDVTAQYNVVRGGFRFDNASGKYVQTVSATTKDNSTAPAGLRFVLDGLTTNVTLANQTGVTNCATPAGSPYLAFPSAAPSSKISGVLQFANPGNVGIRYTLRILSPNAQP